MSRWRRLTREGNKLLVCKERTQSTKGDLWSKNLMLAIHPLYKKIVTPHPGGVSGVEIDDSAVFSFAPDTPKPETSTVYKQVWNGLVDGRVSGTMNTTYKTEVVDSGTWYKVAPPGYNPEEDDAGLDTYGYGIATAESPRGTYEGGVFIPDPIESDEGIWQALADDLDDDAREQKRKSAMSMWNPGGNIYYYHNGEKRYTFVPYYTTFTFAHRCKVKVTSDYDVSWGDGTSSSGDGERTENVTIGFNVRFHQKPGQEPWLEPLPFSATSGTVTGEVSGSPPISLAFTEGGAEVTYEPEPDEDFPAGIDWKQTA